MMEKPGMTVSRWIDGVMEKNELIDQDRNLRAIVYWGHAPNSQTRGKEMVEAMKKLDTLVVIDPYPSATAAMAAMVRQDGVYLLPACDAARDVRLVHRVEPLAAVARARDQPAVRVADRPRDHVRVREEVRLRTRVRQELRDLEAGRRRQVRRADARVDPEGDQPRHVDDRLHRPVARAAQAAHEEHVHLRREDAAREGRPVRRRLLRPAVAVLRHAGDQASGLAQPVRHVAST